MVDKDLEEVCKKHVIKEKDPDEWMKPLTKAINVLFVEHENNVPTSYNHLI